MSRLNITFNVAASYSTVQAVFSSAINHWVENCQSKTSAIAKAFIIENAVEQFQHGSAFIGALSFTAAKGQGTQHPNITTSKVSIPASSFTMGGEMIVTGIASSDGNTTIEIKGHTLGLFGGTLKENVNGLRDYLSVALPDLDKKYKQI
jgi:hypothetical protein